MSQKGPGEDWLEQDFDMLAELAKDSLQESLRCRDAGAPLAALVMLARACESMLLAMVVAHEDDLRADSRSWKPSRMHLSELVQLAEQSGWLTAHDASLLTDVVNKVRTMAAHPGAYVRGMRNAPADLDLRDDAAYLACFDMLARASEQLRDADLAGAQGRV